MRPARACAGQEVPDVGFNGPDGALAGPCVFDVLPERFQAFQFDGVSHGRARAVAFDDVHVRRRPPGRFVGQSHGPNLAFAVRGEKVRGHVVGEPRAANDRVDPVAVANGVLETLQDHHSPAPSPTTRPSAFWSKAAHTPEGESALSAG